MYGWLSNKILDYLNNNKNCIQWIFSGIGLSFLTILGIFIKKTYFSALKRIHTKKNDKKVELLLHEARKHSLLKGKENLIIAKSKCKKVLSISPNNEEALLILRRVKKAIRISIFVYILAKIKLFVKAAPKKYVYVTLVCTSFLIVFIGFTLPNIFSSSDKPKVIKSIEPRPSTTRYIELKTILIETIEPTQKSTKTIESKPMPNETIKPKSIPTETTKPESIAIPTISSMKTKPTLSTLIPIPFTPTPSTFTPTPSTFTPTPTFIPITPTPSIFTPTPTPPTPTPTPPTPTENVG